MPYSWFERLLLSPERRMAVPAPVRLELASAQDDMPAATSLSTIRLKNSRALLALLRNPSLNFGDLYSSGDLEIEGNLVQVIEALYKVPLGTIAGL